jgi:hypothetical protein
MCSQVIWARKGDYVLQGSRHKFYRLSIASEKVGVRKVRDSTPQIRAVIKYDSVILIQGSVFSELEQGEKDWETPSTHHCDQILFH